MRILNRSIYDIEAVSFFKEISDEQEISFPEPLADAFLFSIEDAGIIRGDDPLDLTLIDSTVP